MGYNSRRPHRVSCVSCLGAVGSLQYMSFCFETSCVVSTIFCSSWNTPGCDKMGDKFIGGNLQHSEVGWANTSNKLKTSQVTISESWWLLKQPHLKGSSPSGVNHQGKGATLLRVERKQVPGLKSCHSAKNWNEDFRNKKAIIYKLFIWQDHLPPLLNI